MLILSVFLCPSPGTCESIQKEFIIGGWVGPHQTEEQYRLYKEAGFNTLLDFPSGDENYTKTLSLAEKVGGLSVILNIDQKFLRYKPEPFVPYERIAKFVHEVKNNKQVAGYIIFDEPSAKDADLTIEALKHVRSLDSGRLTWVDFYPYTAEGLARSIMSKSKPAAISACYYPYNVKSDKGRLESMYPVLEFYRSLSLEHGVYLWQFVQSSAWIWRQDRSNDMRMPTASEMRLQVYANLAYGAKGLWYYTYAMPRDVKDASAAILDSRNLPTPAYDSVRQLNREVLAQGPLLMRLTSVDVMHVKPNHKGVKPFASNDVIANVEGENLLIGFFKDSAGVDYFMLVNKLTGKPNSNIRLKLGRPSGKMYQIDRSTGKPISYKLSNGTASVNLAPGDGVLMMVN
jgi:hypothetical protein